MSQHRQRTVALVLASALAVALVAGISWKRRDRAEPARPFAAKQVEAPPPRPPTRFEALPRVIARIGDEEITKDALRAVLDTDEEVAAGNGAAAPDVDDDFYGHALWLAAKSEVTNRVLVAEARRQGLVLAADELAALELPAAQRAQLDQVAPQFGMTGAELVRRREEAKLVEKLVVSRIYDKVPVTEDEIVAVFERETDAFFRPVGYRLRRIVVRPEGGEPDAAVLARAQALARELAAPGADFAKVARRTSAGAERAAGGLMPDFTMQDPPTRDPIFLSAVASLRPGGLSRPMQIGDGYQVVKLEAHLPPRRMTLDEARPHIVKHLQWSKGGPQAMAWAEELERQAGAVILVPMPDEVARSREAIRSGTPQDPPPSP